MATTQSPKLKNEMERLLDLSSFDLDYSSLSDNFKDLTQLAAKVAGTEISLINLIDNFTQWSIAPYGLEVEQMDRKDSVCQYTIAEKDHFEIVDLSNDNRFSDKAFVHAPLNLRYYFGIPLKTDNGHNIGALCVLDSKDQTLPPEKVELLKLIAKEVMNRLNTIKVIHDLKNQLNNIQENHKRVAHDIRGPLAGIIGLSQVIKEQGQSNQLDEVLDFVNLIHKSSITILDLADEILTEEKRKVADLKTHDFNLEIFKEKIEKLYGVQAGQKDIYLEVFTNPENANIFFSKNKLLQIVGNLVSNAIKFTPPGGKVTVSTDLVNDNDQYVLKILVRDTGRGMNQEEIDAILKGNERSTEGTTGELGYGFGLSMVKHLVHSLKGTMEVKSAINEGTSFFISLPQS